LNFLTLLRAGHTDYVINEAALDYARCLAGSVIHQLPPINRGQFADQAAWQAHLDRLDISALKVTRINLYRHRRGVVGASGAWAAA
jgi:hypothetical protein